MNDFHSTFQPAKSDGSQCTPAERAGPLCSGGAARLAAAFGPIRAAALQKFWVDDVFEGLYGVVLLGFSRIVGWIDRYLVDGVLNLLSDWTVSAGDELRGIQTGKPQDYVYGVGAGVLVLILLMRLVF